MSHPLARSGTTFDAGMVIVRPVRDMQAESFSQELLAGLDESLTRVGGTILVKVVPDEETERATYRQWAGSGRITSVIIDDLAEDDSRLALLDELGLLATVSGDVDLAGDHSSIWTDHAGAVRLAVAALYDLGHRSIGHVSGPRRFRHSLARSAAFHELAKELGFALSEAVGDYSRPSGADAARVLLSAEQPPTAIVFDNDLMALGGLVWASENGRRVPDDLSVVAWDDSVRCQMSNPSLAALSHDVRQIGALLGAAAISGRDGRRVTVQTPAPVFVRRGSVSTAPSLDH